MRIFAILLGAAVALGLVQPASADDRACDEPPRTFVAERRPISDVHARALVLLQGGRSDARSGNALIEPMLELVGTAERRFGPHSETAAMVRLDHARLVERYRPDSQPSPTIRKKAALEALDAAAIGSEALSLLVQTEMGNQSLGFSAFEGADILQRRVKLDRLRRSMGDVPALWRAWDWAGGLDNEFGDEAFLRERRKLLEDRAAAFGTTASPRLRMESRLELLRHRFVNGEYMDGDIELVRALLDELERRALLDVSIDERGREVEDCRHVSKKAIDVALKVVHRQGTSAERSRLLSFAVPHSADASMFATDNLGALVHASTLMNARLVDPDAYRRALSIVEYDDCPLGLPRHHCGENVLASAFSGIGAQAVSIDLLESYIDGLRRSAADPVKLRLALLEIAELEWNFGSSSRAEGFVAEALAMSDVELDPSRQAALLALDIRLADARLDDRGVLARVPPLVSIARRVPDPSQAALLSPGRDQMDNLAWKVLRKRLCSTCGEPMRALVDDWIRWRMEEAFEADEYFQGMEWPLLVARLAGGRVVDEKQRLSLSKHYLKLMRAGFHDLGPVDVEEYMDRVADAKKRQVDVNEAANVIALYQFVNDPWISGERFLRFARFLYENEATGGTSTWKEFAADIRSHYEEFGSDRDYILFLDDLGRQLQLNGFPEAADAVWGDMLDQLHAQDLPAQAQPFHERLRMDLVAVTAPAHARTGARKAANGEWAEADRHLTAARTLVVARLSEEWQTGGDRAAFILREVQPALRLVAQTRMRMASEPDAIRLLPGLPAEAFQDLQLAMMEDTAFTVLLSQRRRLIDNPALVEAVRQREAAIHQQKMLDAHETSIGVIDKDWLSQARRSASEDLTQARRHVASILPAPEELASAEPMSLPQAKELLNAGESLVVMHSGSDAVYGMRIKKDLDPVIWIAEVGAGDLAERIAVIRGGTIIEDGRLPPFPVEEAHRLAVDLLGPVLASHDKAGRLLLFVDGSLRSLPFSVLPVRAPTSIPHFSADFHGAGIAWLGATSAMTYLPTLRSLAAADAASLDSRASEPFLGIGDPSLSTVAEKETIDDDMLLAAFTQRGGGGADLRALPMLAGASDELTSMSRSLNGDPSLLLTRDRATETDLKRVDLSRYRIIAFATHALVAGEMEGFPEPGLVLTPPSAPDDDDDGYLSLGEIATLRLDADLVVLSACNTATSDGRPRADGLSGLARGFLAAGARSLFVTHWSVPTGPTSILTSAVFDIHSRDPASGWDEALRQATNRMLNDSDDPMLAHPANWGAFALVGASGSDAR